MKNNLIIIGGYSKKNISWLKRTDKIFSESYNTYPLYYDCWNNDEELSFDIELTKLSNLCNNINNFNILAKSVGSIITLLAIKKGLIKPKKIIIMGYPINYSKKINFSIKKLINEVSTMAEIVVIQQEDDPLGSYNDLKAFLSKKITLIKIPGNTHAYNNTKRIKEITDTFLK